ncbi:hypothetical protein DPMN_059241 [Dreissena polymorpha]|uniref:Uncharacterized protein n=1 Tax=Dreissena polymorpha TaxID=45954 RepID=A0A9D4C3R3_DREPO|nr:hypothetical protein DPMN_059241 [Dreissena polymorpha]
MDNARQKEVERSGSHKLAMRTLCSYEITKTNVLTKFHEEINFPPPGSHFHADRTINVNCIVKNAPPLGSHVFQPTGTILHIVQDIIGTNFPTKFHEDRTINVASRMITTINSPLPDRTVFKHVHDIIGITLLTKFHDDRTINVASRKNAPYLGSHFCQPTVTIFELIQAMIKTNAQTKFHEDWTIHETSREKNAPPPDIIWTNLLTKFQEDRTINAASGVLTGKKALPPGGNVFQATGTIFELIQNIIGTILLNKFHDDGTMKVASRVLKRKNAPPLGGHFF